MGQGGGVKVEEQMTANKFSPPFTAVSVLAESEHKSTQEVHNQQTNPPTNEQSLDMAWNCSFSWLFDCCYCVVLIHQASKPYYRL